MSGELLTPDGRVLAIGQVHIGRCLGCGENSDPQLVVPLSVGRQSMKLCGGCIAEGVAILLGRRHVQAGGSVGDLQT